MDLCTGSYTNKSSYQRSNWPHLVVGVVDVAGLVGVGAFAIAFVGIIFIVCM